MNRDELQRAMQQAIAAGDFAAAYRIEQQLGGTAVTSTPKEKESIGERLRGIGSAVGSGATFGWGDEASAAAAAAIAKATGDDKSFGEIYRDVLDSESDRQQEYRDRHGVESSVLEIGSALGTGGLGVARAAAPITQRIALRRALAGKAGSRAPQILIGAVAATPSLAARVAPKAGVIAAEGAIAGAGTADPGGRVRGAMIGAPTALGTAGAFNLVGRGVNRLGSRTTAQDVGSGENFVPMNVASEGLYGKLVRNFFGRAMGSQAEVERQTERLAQRPIAALARAVDRKKALKERFSHKPPVPEITPTQIPRPDMRQLRVAMAQNAVRPDAMDEVTGRPLREVLAELPDDKAAETLSNWWSRNGFKEAKGKTFKWSDTISTAIEQELKRDPDLAIELSNVGAKIDTLANKVGVEDEALSGEQLIAIRNVFARPSNRMASTRSFDKKALRSVVSRIDKEIKRQVGDEEFSKRFDAEKKFYKVNSIYQEAADKAWVLSDAQFDAKQGLRAVKKVAGKRTEAPFRQELRAFRDADAAAVEAQKAADEESASLLKKAKARQKLVTGRKKERAKEEIAADIAKSREHIAAVQALKPMPDPSGLSSYFTTGAIGAASGAAALAGGLGIPAAMLAIPAGIVGGRGLVTEGAQRFFAGQTEWQKKLADALRKSEKARGLVARAGYRAAAMDEE